MQGANKLVQQNMSPIGSQAICKCLTKLTNFSDAMQSVASHMRTNSKSGSNYKPKHQRDNSTMQMDKDYEELASPDLPMIHDMR